MASELLAAGDDVYIMGFAGQVAGSRGTQVI